MNRKPIPVNPENNALMGIEKVHELRHMIIQTLKTINESKYNNRLEADKTMIFEKLDSILATKEKLMTYLQKCELDFEIKRRVPPIQEYYKPFESDKGSIFEFEKKVFLQKLSVILKKLDYEILIVKFKKLGNNLKAFCFVWDTLFAVYVYIEKPEAKILNEKNKSFRIFDIVVTSIKDKGGSKDRSSLNAEVWNDTREVREMREREIDLPSRIKIDAKMQNLKKLFDSHFCDLVFEPETIFFQKITFFIRKVFFNQKSQSAVELEYLFLWYLNGYKLLFMTENVKCNLCGNRMIFDSAKTGFLPCTIYKNNKFYHDKCFIEK